MAEPIAKEMHELIPTMVCLYGDDITLADALELVTIVNGWAYQSDDLYECHGCGERYVYRSDLDEDMLCEDCHREYEEWEEESRSLRAWAAKVTGV